jgi:SAM-dependent methyltransferase
VTHEHWDDVVASWRGTPRETFLRGYSDAVNTALLERWLPDLGESRVLKTDLFDEAVGTGLHPYLRSHGATVTGVDISPVAVAAARERYPDLDAAIGDVRALSYADSTFDVVVSNSTLDHFTAVGEIETALRELQRVLRPGGLLVITLDNPGNPLVWLRNALPLPLLKRLRLVPYQVGTTYDHKSLARLLRDAGFAVTASDVIMHVPRVLAGALRSIGLGSLRPLLAVEALSRLPTRRLTGQFIAARAVNA